MTFNNSRHFAQTVILIPARYESSRFPGKPLIKIGGKSMISRVWDRVTSANIPQSEVYIATDDERIIQEVISFGGKYLRTSPDCPSGTIRCFEACTQLPYEPEFIINVQGDEPFISPDDIRQLHDLLHKQNAPIATLKRKIKDTHELDNPHCVKVVCDVYGRAMYFSRSVIPFVVNNLAEHIYFRHIGIYGFNKKTFDAVGQMNKGMLYKAESLEQLQWLENGHAIFVGTTTHEAPAVDSPEDLQLVEKYLADNPFIE
jgi:3-deoxy-manno-octulosonate cytidylyltransferase (CMP-KDO synthetase)